MNMFTFENLTNKERNLIIRALAAWQNYLKKFDKGRTTQAEIQDLRTKLLQIKPDKEATS